MSDKDNGIDRFLKALNDEKLQAQQRRAEFNKLKLTFIGGLFALGSVEFKNIDLALVLYIIPFISICFDLYILGEDYGIKRIGGFVQQYMPSEMEAKWEAWVGQRRDPFATYVVPLLSLLVVVASAAVLWERRPNQVFYGIWLLINLVAVVFLFIYSQRLRRRLLSFPVGESKGSGETVNTKQLEPAVEPSGLTSRSSGRAISILPKDEVE
jgi:hypothetical protein